MDQGGAGDGSRHSLAVLEALYDAYHRQALGLAYRMLGDSGEAEEAVQEALLAAWRSAESYDPSKGSTRTWFLSLVRHQCVDVLRARRRRPVEALDETDEPVATDDVESVAATNADAEVAQRALAGLPTEQQEAIRLAYFGGLSHTEIAERVGIPVGTVKGRIRLGLDRLRGALLAPADVSARP